MGEREKAPLSEVPFYVHETDTARMEAANRRAASSNKWLCIVVAIAFIAFAFSAAFNAWTNHLNTKEIANLNKEWIRAWTEYDYAGVDINAQQDGRGINIIGGGSVGYGTESPDQSEDADP